LFRHIQRGGTQRLFVISAWSSASLFGAILGYRWQWDSVECIRFDVRGKVIGMTQYLSMPGFGSQPDHRE
jgi:hypothetical protein